MKPLAIDLFCGLGGWSEGLTAAGYEVVGFDIERHEYLRKITQADGNVIAILDHYPGQLVIQDVLTLHGSQFRDAAVIVASPPRQNYRSLAMPWSRSTDPNNSKAAKELRRKWETEGPDNRLFDACFRIQREACEAAGRHIPLIAENVRGAQPWVGRAKANYGSFYLWGDVEQVGNRIQVGPDIGRFGAGLRVLNVRGVKVPGQINGKEYAFTRTGANGQTVLGTREGEKTVGHVNKRNGHGHTRHLTNQAEHDAVTGTKIGGDWFSDPNSTCRKHGSRSNARKAASAMIAKIPLPLSSYVATALHPAGSRQATVADTSAPESDLKHLALA